MAQIDELRQMVGVDIAWVENNEALAKCERYFEKHYQMIQRCHDQYSSISNADTVIKLICQTFAPCGSHILAVFLNELLKRRPHLTVFYVLSKVSDYLHQ